MAMVHTSLGPRSQSLWWFLIFPAVLKAPTITSLHTRQNNTSSDFGVYEMVTMYTTALWTCSHSLNSYLRLTNLWIQLSGPWRSSMLYPAWLELGEELSSGSVHDLGQVAEYIS